MDYNQWQAAAYAQAYGQAAYNYAAYAGYAAAAGVPAASTPVVSGPAIPTTAPVVSGLVLPQASQPSAPIAAVTSRDEQKPDPKNWVELSCDAKYNIHPVLAQNIQSSEYYAKHLREVKSYPEIVEEIIEKVTNLQPSVIGKPLMPSTAFCILYKLYTMRLTKTQMHSLLTHKNPFCRGVGMLYLRCAGDPEIMWQWLSPYLDDQQQFVPGGPGTEKMTVGQYLRGLFEDHHYYSTLLKRLPAKLDKEFKRALVLMEMRKARARDNERYRRSLEVGQKIKAEYSDGKVYDAVLDEVLENGNFRITWTEYNEQDEIGIEAIVFDESDKKAAARSDSKDRERERDRDRSDRERGRDKDRDRERDRDRRDRDRDRKRSRSRSGSRRRRSRSRSGSRSRRSSRDRDRRRSRDHRSRDRDRSRSRDQDREDRDRSRGRDRGDRELDMEAKIEEEIARRERDKAVASGRDFARRPPSVKGALSVVFTAATGRKKSRSPPREREPRREEYRERDYRDREPSPPRRTASSAQAKANLEKLKAVYGDASGKADKGDKGGKGKKSSAVVDSDAVIRLGF